MSTTKIFGNFFDEQAQARAERDGHGCTLQRAVFKVGGMAFRGHIYTTEGGQVWGYRMMTNGNIRATSSPLEQRHILRIES